MRRASGILKQHIPQQVQDHPQHNADRVKFDEEVIAEHDKFRGTRQKIDEPKTPYENAEDQEEVEATQEDVNMHDEDVHMNETTQDAHHHHHQSNQVIEEEVKRHLEEAERNKQLNAQLQKEKNTVNPASHQEIAHSELVQKLQQSQQDLDDEERKHQEFLKKRKEHYKNEMQAAQLLKRKSMEQDNEDEDDQ